MAQRVVDQDAHDAGHGAGVAAAPARPGRRRDLELDLGLGRAQLELGGHRAAQLAELDGLVAQRDVGVEPAEVEQLAGQPPEAPQLALGAVHLAPGVLLVESAVAQVLLEQLDRALQRRQRRAQLVRGGRHERAPRRLLAAQLALHRGQGPREVADLVAAVVARVGASVPSSATRTAAARRRARRRPIPVASTMPSSTATARPDRGGGDERVAHLVRRPW